MCVCVCVRGWHKSKRMQTQGTVVALLLHTCATSACGSCVLYFVCVAMQLMTLFDIADDSTVFKEYRDQIVLAERVLLASLAFHLDIPTTHDFVKPFFGL